MSHNGNTRHIQSNAVCYGYTCGRSGINSAKICCSAFRIRISKIVDIQDRTPCARIPISNYSLSSPDLQYMFFYPKQTDKVIEIVLDYIAYGLTPCILEHTVIVLSTQ